MFATKATGNPFADLEDFQCVAATMAATEGLSAEDLLYDNSTEIDEARDAFESLTEGLDRLTDFVSAATRYGVNRGMIEMSRRGELLGETSVVSTAFEGLTESLRPNSPQCTAAMEGVWASLKETAGRWAKAAWDFAGKIVSKAGSMIGVVWGKIAKLGERVKNMASDTAADAKRVIKAHPYIAIAATLAAIAAGAGVLTWVWTGGGLPATAAAASRWMATLASKINSIKSPISMFKMAADTGKVTTTAVALAPVTGTSSSMGMNAAKIAELLKKMTDLFKPGGTLAKILSSISGAVRKFFGQITGLFGKGGPDFRPVINGDPMLPAPARAQHAFAPHRSPYAAFESENSDSGENADTQNTESTGGQSKVRTILKVLRTALAVTMTLYLTFCAGAAFGIRATVMHLARTGRL